ncbi:hypothetical protein SEVIR_9G332350v4 [Setaria viridis]
MRARRRRGASKSGARARCAPRLMARAPRLFVPATGWFDSPGPAAVAFSAVARTSHANVQRSAARRSASGSPPSHMRVDTSPRQLPLYLSGANCLFGRSSRIGIGKKFRALLSCCVLIFSVCVRKRKLVDS